VLPLCRAFPATLTPVLAHARRNCPDSFLPPRRWSNLDRSAGRPRSTPPPPPLSCPCFPPSSRVPISIPGQRWLPTRSVRSRYLRLHSPRCPIILSFLRLTGKRIGHACFYDTPTVRATSAHPNFTFRFWCSVGLLPFGRFTQTLVARSPFFAEFFPLCTLPLSSAPYIPVPNFS